MTVAVRPAPRAQGSFLPSLALWTGIWLLVLAFSLAIRESILENPPLPDRDLIDALLSEPPALLPEPGTTLEGAPEVAIPSEIAAAPAKSASDADPLLVTRRELAEILAPPPPATSPPTRIMAPSIGLDAEIFSVGWAAVTSGTSTVVRWEVANGAAGWHQNSVLPGNEGNVVLSGHHNIRGEVFRYLIDLEEGDEIRLLAGDEVYRYKVATKVILQERGMPLEVRLQNARWIAATDHERLTLVTCWPYSTNSHRLILVALPARTSPPFATAS